MERKCTKCGEMLPFEAFYKHNYVAIVIKRSLPEGRDLGGGSGKLRLSILPEWVNLFEV